MTVLRDLRCELCRHLLADLFLHDLGHVGNADCARFGTLLCLGRGGILRSFLLCRAHHRLRLLARHHAALDERLQQIDHRVAQLVEIARFLRGRGARADGHPTQCGCCDGGSEFSGGLGGSHYFSDGDYCLCSANRAPQAHARETIRRLTGCGMSAGGPCGNLERRESAASMARSRSLSPLDCAMDTRSTVPSSFTQTLTVTRVRACARALLVLQPVENLVLQKAGVPRVGAAARRQQIAPALAGCKTETIAACRAFRIEAELLARRRLVGGQGSGSCCGSGTSTSSSGGGGGGGGGNSSGGGRTMRISCTTFFCGGGSPDRKLRTSQTTAAGHEKHEHAQRDQRNETIFLRAAVHWCYRGSAATTSRSSR